MNINNVSRLKYWWGGGGWLGALQNGHAVSSRELFTANLYYQYPRHSGTHRNAELNERSTHPWPSRNIHGFYLLRLAVFATLAFYLATQMNKVAVLVPVRASMTLPVSLVPRPNFLHAPCGLVTGRTQKIWYLGTRLY